jgi:GNAT superfamily N-acetyltransferase
LSGDDDLSGFVSGEAGIDSWLIDRAIKAEAAQTARTYIVTDLDTSAIVGYYCLSSHAVVRAETRGWLSRNTPDPIPVILLGRLGIDNRYQGQGLGAALLKDALLRAIAAARLVGARALLVHAVNDEIVAFYQRYEFRAMPSSPRTLYLPLDRLTDRAQA